MTTPNRWAVVRVSANEPFTLQPKEKLKRPENGNKWVSLVPNYGTAYAVNDFESASRLANGMQAVHGSGDTNFYIIVEFYFEEGT